jgi:hypothetical protein
MIHAIQHRAIETVESPQDVVSIEDMVRHFAVQHFVQAMLGGEPELTGIPDLSGQDG